MTPARPGTGGKTAKSGGDDARLGAVVSWVLLAGLSLAIALILVGVALSLARTTAEPAHETWFSDLPRALRAGESGAFFELGLAVLLVSPVAAVLVIGTSFARRRSWRFLAVCLVVVAILALSVFLGLRG